MFYPASRTTHAEAQGSARGLVMPASNPDSVGTRQQRRRIKTHVETQKFRTRFSTSGLASSILDPTRKLQADQLRIETECKGSIESDNVGARVQSNT